MEDKKSIEIIMNESGFIKTTRWYAGKIYVEYLKDGICIDEDDITFDGLQKMRKD